MYAIDPWCDDDHERVMAGCKNVAIHNEKAVRHDIAHWLPKLRSDSLIGGHDDNLKDWPGVVRAIHQTFGRPDAVYDDTSSVTRWTKPTKSSRSG